MLSKKNIFREYLLLKKIERNTIAENKKIQQGKLVALLEHAYKYVPYYREVLPKSGVIEKTSDGSVQVNLDKFSNIPILTKAIIRKRWNDLLSEDPGFKARMPYKNTSGGSTGEPAEFMRDKTTWTEGMAGKWLFFTFGVEKFPCRLLKLWGAERDVLLGGIGFSAKFKNWLYNRKILNTFKMSESDMEKYTETINKYKPKIIEAYAQSIYEFSLYIIKHQYHLSKPTAIFTSVGTLTDQMRNVIEKAFGCRVYNRYGSREVGDMACSCKTSTELHANIIHYFIEVLDENKLKVKPGNTGDIYVTSLNNYSMPLIRYEIGDMAMIAKQESCSCGSGFPLLGSVIGRVGSMITTKNGTLDGIAVSTLLYYYKDHVPFSSFMRYQLIQERKDLVILKIAVDNQKKWLYEKPRVIEKFSKALGDGVRFEIEEVEKIEPLKNGKFIYIINKTLKK